MPSADSASTSLRGALGRFGPQTGKRAAFLLQCGQGSQRPRDQFRAGVAVGRKRAENNGGRVRVGGGPRQREAAALQLGLGDAFQQRFGRIHRVIREV